MGNSIGCLIIKFGSLISLPFKVGIGFNLLVFRFVFPLCWASAQATKNPSTPIVQICTYWEVLLCRKWGQKDLKGEVKAQVSHGIECWVYFVRNNLHSVVNTTKKFLYLFPCIQIQAVSSVLYSALCTLIVEKYGQQWKSQEEVFPIIFM